MKRTQHLNLMVFISLIFMLNACNKENKSEVAVFKVAEGKFQIEITEEGEVKATNSINISTPNLSSWRYGSLKITSIVEDGTQVNKGDIVVTFDPSEVQKAIVSAEGRLEINKAELERLKAQHQSELEELSADYEVTKINREISEIKFENADYFSEIERKKIKLNLEQAEIELDKALVQIENRKKIQHEEIQQKLLSIEQARAELKESNDVLKQLVMVSSAPGIAIITENWTTDNKFQIGDQCWSGSPLIQLPDLNELKADVKINEVDISKIKNGLKVEIRPDAFSGKVLSGEVISVANLAVNKERNSRIKIFPVEILIQSDPDIELLPGLTVSCKIIIEEINDVLSIPLEALYHDLNQDYVYIKSSGGFQRRDVSTSLANNDFIMVTDGLKAGDEVAMVYPFEEEKSEKSDHQQTEDKP